MTYQHPDLPGFLSPAPFAIGGGDEAVNYAFAWWEKATPEEIDALGFVEYVPPPPEPPKSEQIIEAFRISIQGHVDATAIGRRYDSGNSLATYVTSTVAQWASEAEAFIAWRDAVWVYTYAELDRVKDGEREQPTIAEFLGELPPIEWPE